MERNFGYYDYLRLHKITVEPIVKADEEIISFIIRNFDEILEVLGRDI